VGCSGAGGARDCGCGAAEVAVRGEQDCGGGLAAVLSGEEEEGRNAGV
jgi:hypothetical protein